MISNSFPCWRRALWLFLRSRRFVLSALAILASALIFWVLLVNGVAASEMRGLQIVAPLLPALVLGVSISGPFGDIEQTASLPIWRLRLLHVGGLLLLAVLALVLVSRVESELDRTLLLRNLAGYTGMAWLGSQVVGPAFTPIFVWALPIAYVMMIWAVDSSRWWAWAKQSTAVDSATLIAATLLSIGLFLIVVRPSTELVSEGGVA